MNRILVILSMVLSIVLAGTIVQPLEGTTSPQRSAVSSSGTNLPGTQELQSYSTAASSPQGVVSGSPILYGFPTYDNYEKAFSVRTDAETYVIPTTTPEPEPESSWGSGIWSVMSPVSRFALTYGARAGLFILNLVLLLVLGAVFTTSICAFTPLCTITVLGLGKAEVKEQVTEIARTFMTPERISAATKLVKRAIEKYTAMQKEPDTKETENTEEES